MGPKLSGITVSPGMQEMPSLNMPVQRLKLSILPLDLPCSGPVTHSVDRFSVNDDTDVALTNQLKI